MSAWSRDRLARSFLAILIGIGSAVPVSFLAAEEPKPAPASGPTTASAPASTQPAPTAWIKNPYYPRPVWRLWTEDPTPLHYVGRRMNDSKTHEGTFAPPPLEKRQYPDLAAPFKFPAPFLALTKTPGAAAGFWDDAYVTMDGAHTVIPNNWSDVCGNSLNLADQFIRIDFGNPNFNQRMQLGINFTSQSHSEQGHHIVANGEAYRHTEREYFFANTVRGTPAFFSYKDTLPEKVIDSYDALFCNSFQSLGRSGSETGGLRKMLIAGGYLPDPVKRLLKLHGCYPATLLMIYRAALPYADEKGEVPYESELRHRPAYLSSGNARNAEFMPFNYVYSGYNESLHLFRMIELARNLKAAPPVALVSLRELDVLKGGCKIENDAEIMARIKSMTPTMIRLWGKPGETLSAVVDLRGSYDLQDLPLAYEAHAVYPQQHNINIETIDVPGVFGITVKHDPKLPKGRIPVLLAVRNGKAVSAPVFINFYWPEEGQLESPPYFSPGKAGDPPSKNEVTRNLRPEISTSLAGDVTYCPAEKDTSFKIITRDPEGFPVHLYRWSDDVGRLEKDTFTYQPAAREAGRVRAAHFIASDGTGGYNSLLVRLIVGQEDEGLPQGWQTTILGLPEMTGHARFDGANLELSGCGSGLGRGDEEGYMVYRPAAGDVDLMAEALDLQLEGSGNTREAKAGLILREVEGPSPRVLLAQVTRYDKKGGLVAGWSMRDKTSPYGVSGSPAAPPQGVIPGLRLIRRGSLAAAYVSVGPGQWEQSRSVQWNEVKTAQAGVAITSGDSRRGLTPATAKAKFKLLEPPTASLPLISGKGTAPKANAEAYEGAVEITIAAPSDKARIYYTLDKSDPTEKSKTYAGPFKLDTPGECTLKARAYTGGQAGDVVTTVMKIVQGTATAPASAPAAPTPIAPPAASQPRRE